MAPLAWREAESLVGDSSRAPQRVSWRWPA
jgi:hypothetical protein